MTTGSGHTVRERSWRCWSTTGDGSNHGRLPPANRCRCRMNIPNEKKLDQENTEKSFFRAMVSITGFKAVSEMPNFSM